MMLNVISTVILILTSVMLDVNAFMVPKPSRSSLALVRSVRPISSIFLSSDPSSPDESTTTASVEESGEPETAMDAAMRAEQERIKRVETLKAQEVFIQRSTGIYLCDNCGYEFDTAKGDVMMIGGTVQPGTPFEDLPSNWRCPTCRASKDSFTEKTLEIPGFEVNQGYGFGTNSWTSSQKTGVIFGGLFLFFVVFIGGYALS